MVIGFSLPIHGFSQTMANTLTVTGSGSTQAVPDAYTLSVTLEEKGASVAKLQGSMQHRLEQIIAFLIDEQIALADIQSMNINLYPWYKNSQQGREQAGVVLSRQIVVQGRNLDDYDIIIDGLLARGINRIDQFRFVHSDETAIRNQSILLAIDDAKAKAALMAKRLDQKLNGVISVSQHGISAIGNPSPVRFRAESMDTSLPGSIDFPASVQVTFAIETSDNQ